MRAGGFHRRRALFCVIVSAAFAGAGSPVLAGCDLDLQGDGHVAAVTGPRTLRLTDGREIRLTGIEIPQTAQDTATAALTAAARDYDVTLHGGDDTPDRYGRQPAVVIVYGEERSLQEALIAQGAAIVGAEPDPSCRAAMQAAERDARQSRKGAWSNPDFVRRASEPDKILNDIGHFTLVEGQLQSVRDSRGTTYLNFSRRWNQGFAATISRRMMPAFAAAGVSPAALNSKRIRVRGWVEQRGGPRMEVTRPDQIELIGDNSAVAAGGN